MITAHHASNCVSTADTVKNLCEPSSNVLAKIVTNATAISKFSDEMTIVVQI